MSKAYLSKHLFCEECEKEKIMDGKYSCQISEEVHHIVPIQTEEGWKRRLDISNLVALCHFHHD
ncbi:MAG: HNH endonuclease [Methanosphaera sp.]|nr:HNH endonuclease [Methanosphaera sp.]